nr:MAG TPA: hypothetical protein [Caudoviricetes sp.]
MRTKPNSAFLKICNSLIELPSLNYDEVSLSSHRQKKKSRF